MQVKSFQEDKKLNLDMISPIWAKRLEQSKLLSPVCLRRLRWYLELKSTSKCVVGEAYGFSSSYVSSCKLCCRISWKFMFYFMICSYSKLEETKNEFVTHWSEKHRDYHQQPNAKKIIKFPLIYR